MRLALAIARASVSVLVKFIPVSIGARRLKPVLPVAGGKSAATRTLPAFCHSRAKSRAEATCIAVTKASKAAVRILRSFTPILAGGGQVSFGDTTLAPCEGLARPICIETAAGLNTMWASYGSSEETPCSGKSGKRERKANAALLGARRRRAGRHGPVCRFIASGPQPAAGTLPHAPPSKSFP